MSHAAVPKAVPTRIAHGLLACALALALVPLAPSAAALADEGDGGMAASSELARAFAQANEDMLQCFNVSGNPADLLSNHAANGFGADSGIMALGESGFPEKYDLREKDKVTSVKFQNPWGTCWGFAAIAASETSILSSTGGAASSGLDLSELQLAWFTYTPLSEAAVDSGDVNTASQVGEGYCSVDRTGTPTTDPEVVLNQGGTPPTSTSMLSSGTGPIAETLVPYKNKAGTIQEDAGGNPLYYTEDGDWSVDESWRFASSFQLTDGNLLPSPAARDSSGTYTYNQAGTDAIKQELSEGRAVLINFAADDALPGTQRDPKYINTYEDPATGVAPWAHYTYDNTGATHAVTIVGWDDTYSKDNFLTSEQVPGAVQPPDDGAWIVKNSWGAEDNVFPNKYTWGYEGSGYFYLSYYDKSIVNVESLEYDTSVPSGSGYHLVDQYDFLPSTSPIALPLTSPSAMASVFTATERQTVRAVSCETAYPNTTVTYQVYLLNEGATQPKDGSLAATVTKTYQYAGYHRADLSEGVLLEKGQKYSVVAAEQTVNDSGAAVYPVQVDRGYNKLGWQWAKDVHQTTLTTYANGIVNAGESFLITMEDGKESTQDWAESVTEQKKRDAAQMGSAIYDYDNFSVKAYADPTPAPEPSYEPGAASETVGEGDTAMTVEVAGEFLQGSSPRLVLSRLEGSVEEQLAALADGKQPVLSIDAKLVDSKTGDPVPFQGALTLTFALGHMYEGREVAVIHLLADGGNETFATTVAGGKASVQVTSLSPFGVFAQDAAPAPAGGDKLAATGDAAALPATAAGAAGALALCFLAFCIGRSRENRPRR